MSFSEIYIYQANPKCIIQPHDKYLGEAII